MKYQNIGEDWIVHLEQLQQLKKFATDPGFQRAIQTVKQENKMKVAQYLTKEYGVNVNPASLFDIQARLTISKQCPNLILVFLNRWNVSTSTNASCSIACTLSHFTTASRQILAEILCQGLSWLVARYSSKQSLGLCFDTMMLLLLGCPRLSYGQKDYQADLLCRSSGKQRPDCRRQIEGHLLGELPRHSCRENHPIRWSERTNFYCWNWSFWNWKHEIHGMNCCCTTRNKEHFNCGWCFSSTERSPSAL